MTIIGNPRSFTVNQYSLEQALRLMVELGFTGVELCSPDIELCRTDQLRQHLAGYISSLGLTLIRYNVAAAEYFDSIRSRGNSRKIREGLKRDIDIAASLGVSQMLTWEGRAPEGARHEDIHGWILYETIDLFREAVPYARDRGVRLTVEVHPFTLGIELNFLIKLCDSLPPDDFGVIYDCAHFGVGLPDGYIDAIRQLGARIKHVHFSDSDKHSSEVHFPPGRGCLNLPGILTALKEVGFAGTVMLDTWLYPLPAEAARIGIEYLRQALPGLGLDD